MGDLDQVEAEALAWSAQATDAQGRKLRKDAHCLLAGVISLPRSNEEDWPKFKAEALEWLKKKYGENLRCVIEHQDESHPHIHFYAVAKNGQSFDDLHEGVDRKREIKHGKTAAGHAMLGLSGMVSVEVRLNRASGTPPMLRQIRIVFRLF